jgi:hypothetical protein
METKPFSMQSPEQIAKDYGGNKQKIAEAMQMGILDPTAGTLAGMFIDRMRSAAQAEGAPQQTVAEQVFAPPAPPTGAPAGLGATPEAAAMPPMNATPPQEMGAPQMEMPAEEMPMMAEGGMVPPYMAGGGLSDVPLPDGMFDEPSNGGFGDGYAGGGMVAFAPGGDVDAARLRRALLMQESGGDYGVVNAEGSGAMGAYQFMPPTARALAKRLGLEYRPDLMSGDKGRSKEGRAYQERLMDAQMEDILAYSGGDVGKAGAYHFAGPNTKGHGAKTRKYEQDILRRYSGSKDSGGDELADAARGGNTLYGLPTDLQGNIAMLTGMMPAEAEEDIEYRKELTEQLSPENRAQAKKDAFFEGLGKLGARLAGAKDKSLLGGLAETLGAGAADIADSLDEDKKRIREMQRERSQLANLSRKEKMEVLQMGVDLTGRVAALNEGIENRKAEVAAKQEEIKLRRDQLNAEIAAAKSKGLDVDQMVFQMFLQGGPLKEAAKEYLGARYKGSDSEAGSLEEKLTGKQNEKQNPASKYQ